MNQDAALLSGDGLVVVGLYLLLLIGVGVAARMARREESLADFYLSGRTLGPFVLFLTLYATQYSGLTLIGFAGNAYRKGFAFLVSVTFGCSIIGGYLIIAPRLRKLSERRGYITVGDFVHDRFGSRRLTTAGSAVFVFALAAYILSNLKAMGHVVEAATGGAVSFTTGVIALSVLMVAYETLGGLRAVAWTDVLQGLILMVACVAIFIAIGQHYGTPGQSATRLLEVAPDKWGPPSIRGKLGWGSTLLLVSFGVSIYPHAIQRIYAARNAQVLRRSMQWMLVMPFLTTLLMVGVGLIGAAHFPGLTTDQSEQVVLIVLQDLAHAVPTVRILIVVLVCALVAAIMSTVDSALLAISSLVTQDLYALYRPGGDQATLARLGKGFSWVLMALLVLLALWLPQTLWRLTEIKLEVLCQMAPAIFLGLHVRRVDARGVGLGLAAGLSLTLVLLLGEQVSLPVTAKPLGIHAGIWGLLLNGILVMTLSGRRTQSLEEAGPGSLGVSSA